MGILFFGVKLPQEIGFTGAADALKINHAVKTEIAFFSKLTITTRDNDETAQVLVPLQGCLRSLLPVWTFRLCPSPED